MKKNIIFNCLTLFITAFLLILVVMAWFVTNDKAEASGINGFAEGNKFRLEIQKGTYENSKWTWESTESLGITNMKPGNVFFFRYKINVKKVGGFTTELSGIESSIDEDINFERIYDGDNEYHVEINGLPLAKMNSTGTEAIVLTKPSVASTDTPTSKKLFLYDDSTKKFSLKDFKVENTFIFYDYRVGTENFYKPGTQEFYDDNVTNDTGIVSKPIVGASCYYEINELGVKYAYFALEFNEALSNICYEHMDGTYKQDSNLFQAQKLSIRRIGLKESD